MCVEGKAQGYGGQCREGGPGMEFTETKIADYSTVGQCQFPRYSFLKKIILLNFRERKGEGSRERNTNVKVKEDGLPPARAPLGIKPTTRECVLTRN